MKQSKALELVVGLFIAAGLGALLVLAMQVSNLTRLHPDNGYRVTARFNNIGGLKVRSPVSVAGVKVGRVADIDYDSDRYEALVTMQIDGKYDKFPDDTSASIFTAGLLGEQYVSLEPGGSTEYLKDGSNIDITQSALVLEQLISKFLFDKASEAK